MWNKWLHYTSCASSVKAFWGETSLKANCTHTFPAAHTTLQLSNTRLPTHMHIYPLALAPLYSYTTVCVSVATLFSQVGGMESRQGEIDFLESDRAGLYFGQDQQPPPHPSPNSTDQTAGWLITPPPLPSAHRWDVRLKVDGEQHGVWCYTPSYRLELGHQTAPLAPLACCLMRFVSFRYPSTATHAICHYGALLKTPLKMGGESLLLWFWVIYEVLECAYRAVALQCFACGISKYPKLSEQSTLDRGNLPLPHITGYFHSTWRHTFWH